MLSVYSALNPIANHLKCMNLCCGAQIIQLAFSLSTVRVMLGSSRLCRCRHLLRKPCIDTHLNRLFFRLSIFLFHFSFPKNYLAFFNIRKRDFQTSNRKRRVNFLLFFFSCIDKRKKLNENKMTPTETG